MNQIQLSVIDDFATHILRSPEVEVRVVPGLGAKITSLRDLRSGREWLWSAPDGRGLRTNHPGDDFADSSLAGMDECFPTVLACQWQGVPLPDHGEAWSRPWTVDADAWERQQRLVTSLDLACLPLRMERELVLVGEKIELRYRLTNLSSQPQPDFWAFHPLFAWREGDRIALPPEIATVKIESQAGLDLPVGEIAPWPCPRSGLDLSTLKGPANVPWCVKLFAPAPKVGPVAIINDRAGESLGISFAPGQTPHLGIWITCGGWNGFHHVALEPTTHAGDTPAAAGGPGLNLLPAHASRSWQVDLSLRNRGG